MKSNFEMVPGFDEIIFENRNRKYGAYDLRRKYILTACLSVLSGVSLYALLTILFTIVAPETATAKSEEQINVVLTPDNLIDPNKIIPVPEKPVPAAPENKYIKPDVVDDTVDIDQAMISTDLAAIVVSDGEVTDVIDSVIFVPVTNEPEEPEPFTFVKEMPEFPGGSDALLKFIAENTKYPEVAIENNIQGRVFVKFAVMANGSVSRIEIMRSVHPLLDKEAERVVSSMPLWKPGKQNGIPVPVWFTVPVDFRILYY